MSVLRLKLLLGFVLSLLACYGGWLALAATARFITYFEEGANPATALNIVPNVPPNLNVDLTWLPGDERAEALIDPMMRVEVESSYLRAWLQVNLSYSRKEPWGLQTYFAGPALSGVSETIEQATSADFQVARIESRHALELHFCSADRSVVAFTDHDVLLAQLASDERTGSSAFHDIRATYDVVMMLEDGNWRVRHWLRTAGRVLGVPKRPQQSSFVSVGRRDFRAGKRPFLVRGTRYSGRYQDWVGFWEHYDPRVIARDLARARQLGLTVLEVSIPFEQWGPQPPSALVRHLQNLLDRAGEHGLKILVTLFSTREHFELLRWNEADRHVQALASAFAEHPHLLAWVIDRSPDADRDGATSRFADAWFAHTSRLVSDFDPHHLVSLSSSDPKTLERLSEHADFLIWRPEGSPGAEQLRWTQTQERPVLMGGFQASSWLSYWFPAGGGESAQAAELSTHLRAIRSSAVSGFVAGTLIDMDQAPFFFGSFLPWNRSAEKHTGLLRTDGSAKRASRLLRRDSALEDSGVLWEWLTQPFFRTVACGATFWLVVWLVRRRRKLTA